MKNMFELDEFVNTPTPENLLLVDCLNLSFRFKHRGQVEFAGEFLRTISSLAKSYGAKKVVLLADKGKSVFRKNLHPEYKANRAAAYANQTEEEAEKARLFFEGYERALELASEMYPLIRQKGVEADDLAAYIVKNKSDMFTHTWLVSSDADWDLLLSDKVSRFSFVTRKEYTIDNFYDEHNCDNPEEYISVKALQGDAGDGIPGVQYVGPKRAYNLVKEYGSAFDLAMALPLPGKQKVILNLNDSYDLIMRNIPLVDLLGFCDEAILAGDENNIVEIEEIFHG